MISALFKEGWCGRGVIALLMLIVVCLALISPGLNALLIPHLFPRVIHLQGVEQEWINNNSIPHNCNWQVGVICISLDLC